MFHQDLSRKSHTYTKCVYNKGTFWRKNFSVYYERLNSDILSYAFKCTHLVYARNNQYTIDVWIIPESIYKDVIGQESLGLC